MNQQAEIFDWHDYKYGAIAMDNIVPTESHTQTNRRIKRQKETDKKLSEKRAAEKLKTSHNG